MNSTPSGRPNLRARADRLMLEAAPWPASGSARARDDVIQIQYNSRARVRRGGTHGRRSATRHTRRPTHTGTRKRRRSWRAPGAGHGARGGGPPKRDGAPREPAVREGAPGVRGGAARHGARAL
eukprot:scaffold210_cov450-Prasinococcus_capsulatus_cf.AAC.2